MNEPAHAQSQRPLWPHVHRHLVGRTADPAGLDLQLGLDIAQGAVPNLHRIVLGLLSNDVEGPINDPLRHRLFPRVHHRVDEFRQTTTGVHHLIRELRIRKQLALGYFTFTGHGSYVLRSLGPGRLSRCYLGRLAPYFERPWRRLVTPWVSRLPRMMW